MKIIEMFLTPNRFSRPGTKLERVKKIAVHYVGNPGTTAIANHNYFENLKSQNPADRNARYVSSHFIVDLGGEIIQNIPLDEWSYCTNQANGYSISIECCHPDASGKFTEATEQSLAELCAYLCRKFGLTANDIIRHYDVTGKQCPLYWSPTKYVSKETADGRFNAFRNRVSAMLGGVPAEAPADAGKFPYKVKIICGELNVRKLPGTSSPIVCKLTKGYVYTIAEERTVGTVPWGKLKSGAGWISLLDKYVKRV